MTASGPVWAPDADHGKPIVALGSVVGALLAARKERPRIGLLFAGAALFGCGVTLATFMPNYGLFSIALGAVSEQLR